MDEKNKPLVKIVDDLKERAKELNTLLRKLYDKYNVQA